MFRRCLVPLDGSRLAESVLPAVRRFGFPGDCLVTLLHVVEKGAPASVHGDVHLQEVRQAQTYLESVAAKLRADGLKVELHVHEVPQEDVPRGIADHAKELDKDLIVLCSHGRGGWRRFVFGSNAERVLAHGTTPVLLIRPNENGVAPPVGPHRIVILLDHLPETVLALEAGGELAERSGAELLLLGVVPTVERASGDLSPTSRLAPRTARYLRDMEAEDLAERLAGEVEKLTARRVRAGARVDRGDAAAVLARTAREIRADLVVLAVRGLAGLSAFWADAIPRKIAGSYEGALLLLRRVEAG